VCHKQEGKNITGPQKRSTVSGVRQAWIKEMSMKSVALTAEETRRVRKGLVEKCDENTPVEIFEG
jgi:hypothetical protein